MDGNRHGRYRRKERRNEVNNEENGDGRGEDKESEKRGIEERLSRWQAFHSRRTLGFLFQISLQNL